MNRFSSQKTWKRGVLTGALMVSALLVFSACSSDDDPAPVAATPTVTPTPAAPSGTALKIAEKVSVVDAKTTASTVTSLRFLSALQALAVADFSATSQYNTDPTNVYVEERSASAFDIVNEILCFLAQAKYGELVNTGDYKAQIDDSKCSSSEDSASGGGQQNQSSGGNTPDYTFTTVNSSRQDNSSDQIVKIWFHEEDEGQKSLIMLKLMITAEATTTNPLGLFTLNFVFYPENADGTPDTTSAPAFKGFLGTVFNSATNQVEVQFVMDGIQTSPMGSVTIAEAATLTKSADGTSGSGSVSLSFTSSFFNEVSAFNVAFNETHFLRENTLASSNQFQCLDRNAFNTTVWRYGLYDTNGSRVTRNSGFPIRYEEPVGTNNYGWVGFWGLWMPNNVTIPDGATVFKQEFGTDGAPTETAHTVSIKGGKLIKHTKNTLTLADVKGIPLEYYDDSTMGQFRVEWNGTVFNKVAQLASDSQGGFTWQDITPPVALSLNPLNWDRLNFWSNALGGSLDVKLTCTGTFPLDCTGGATDASVVTFFAEAVVSPTDTVPAALRCYDRCPDPATIATAAEPWLDNNNWNPSTLVNYDYAFSTATLLLTYNGVDVVANAAHQSNQWGIHSGPMFEATTANIDLLDCDWDATLTCSWKVREALSFYYTWETGPNDWNKYTALVDSSGAIVAFDAPLTVEYTHTDSNAAKYYLEYSGFGDLHGIPGICVNFETGDPESCGQNSRWIPEFSIADGAEVINSADSTIHYHVKALDKEQQMKVAAEATCTAAGLTTSSATLPLISAWVDPAIGAEPVVTGPPKVIAGVIQTL